MISKVIKRNINKELHEKKFIKYCVAGSLSCTMAANEVRKIAVKPSPVPKVNRLFTLEFKQLFSYCCFRRVATFGGSLLLSSINVGQCILRKQTKVLNDIKR